MAYLRGRGAPLKVRAHAYSPAALSEPRALSQKVAGMYGAPPLSRASNCVCRGKRRKFKLTVAGNMYVGLLVLFFALACSGVLRDVCIWGIGLLPCVDQLSIGRRAAAHAVLVQRTVVLADACLLPSLSAVGPNNEQRLRCFSFNSGSCCFWTRGMGSRRRTSSFWSNCTIPRGLRPSVSRRNLLAHNDIPCTYIPL